MATPDNLQHPVGSSCFLNRLLALPSVHDALALTNSYYQRTKDYKYVGAVVGATEKSLRVAVVGVMPLATPVFHRVGDWQALDEWACRRLESVELMAPIVKLPTNEVLEDVRERVLCLVAGGPATAEEPLTLSNAIAVRVHSTVELASSSKSGRVAIDVTERLLDVAHILLDHCLPPTEENQLQDSDGRSGGVVTKASTLAFETHRRLYRVAHSVVHPHHPDCDASTSTQLVGCALAGAREWYWTPWQMSNEAQHTTVARVLLRMVIGIYVRFVASLRELLRLLASFNPSSATTMVVRGVSHHLRYLTDKARELLCVFFYFLQEWANEPSRSATDVWEQWGMHQEAMRADPQENGQLDRPSSSAMLTPP